MNKVYILLGGNVGNRLKSIDGAQLEIEKRLGTICKKSSVYETAAWGKTDQPSFLNQVIEVNTSLSETETLAEIEKSEEALGRIRKEKWGERVIDIDILYFNNTVFVNPDLKIPHPELHKRRFTLTPLVEIAPDYIHPIFNVSNQELLNRCEDALEVKRFIERDTIQ